MGSLARLADVRAMRVENDIPRLIDRAIELALAPLRDKVTKCEGLVEANGVRADVTQLPSTDLSILWGEVPLLDAPAFETPPKLNSEPTSCVQLEIATSVDIADKDVERDDDDLANEMDEEEMRSMGFHRL
ncbi:hypothetical protein KY289_011037 [Solanum tuberosum]|nr:hypothetical protein KY289_011037 [Solanum tuberosum]